MAHMNRQKPFHKTCVRVVVEYADVVSAESMTTSRRHDVSVVVDDADIVAVKSLFMLTLCYRNQGLRGHSVSVDVDYMLTRVSIVVSYADVMLA